MAKTKPDQSRNRPKERASERSSGIWRRKPSGGTRQGGSRPDLAATIMTEDAKTEKHTVGEPYGAYIKTALQVSACRALKITSQTIFRDIEITVAV